MFFGANMDVSATRQGQQLSSVKWTPSGVHPNRRTAVACKSLPSGVSLRSGAGAMDAWRQGDCIACVFMSQGSLRPRLMCQRRCRKVWQSGRNETGAAEAVWRKPLTSATKGVCLRRERQRRTPKQSDTRTMTDDAASRERSVCCWWARPLCTLSASDNRKVLIGQSSGRTRQRQGPDDFR